MIRKAAPKSLVRRLDKLDKVFNSRAKKLGLTVCAKPS
jgi:hypothetical protein